MFSRTCPAHKKVEKHWLIVCIQTRMRICRPKHQLKIFHCFRRKILPKFEKFIYVTKEKHLFSKLEFVLILCLLSKPLRKRYLLFPRCSDFFNVPHLILKILPNRVFVFLHFNDFFKNFNFLCHQKLLKLMSDFSFLTIYQKKRKPLTLTYNLFLSLKIILMSYIFKFGKNRM